MRENHAKESQKKLGKEDPRRNFIGQLIGPERFAIFLLYKIVGFLRVHVVGRLFEGEREG